MFELRCVESPEACRRRGQLGDHADGISAGVVRG
jgi:hypothetical protein